MKPREDFSILIDGDRHCCCWAIGRTKEPPSHYTEVADAYDRVSTDYCERDIRVNVTAPGPTGTNVQTNARDGGSDPRMRPFNTSAIVNVPIGYSAEPEEMAVASRSSGRPRPRTSPASHYPSMAVEGRSEWRPHSRFAIVNATSTGRGIRRADAIRAIDADGTSSGVDRIRSWSLAQRALKGLHRYRAVRPDR